MAIAGAKAAENLLKNRYKDISPYDQTRVLLRNLPSGDYINANYINMEIPITGIVNRYIAAQGPLSNTCADFWEMVWQQQITLVVRYHCHHHYIINHLYRQHFNIVTGSTVFLAASTTHIAEIC